MNLAAGTYEVSERWTIPDGESLSGAGKHTTVIRQADGANIDGPLVVNEAWWDSKPTVGHPVIVRDLTIDGNKANNTGAAHGLVLSTWNALVDNVQVKNTTGDGIRLTVTNRDASVVTTSAVENHLRAVRVVGCDGDGIAVLDSGGKLTDGYILDSIVGQCAGTGINLRRAAGWKVRGNHVYAVGKHGILLLFCQDTQVALNQVIDFGVGATPGTWHGLSVGSMLDGRPTIVLGNQVRTQQPTVGSTYRGLFLGAASAASGARVEGSSNVVEGADIGVRVEGAAGGLVDGSLGVALWGCDTDVDVQSGQTSVTVNVR